MRIQGLRRLTFIATFASASMAVAYSYKNLPDIEIIKKPRFDSVIVENEAAVFLGYIGKARLEGDELTAWLNERPYQNADMPMPGSEVAKFNFASGQVCISGFFNGSSPKEECHSMGTLDGLQTARLKNLACDVAVRGNNREFIKQYCP